MEFELTHARLRPLRREDAASFAVHANDAAVARELPDRFVHPYSEQNALEFIAKVHESDPPTVLAIEVDGACVGTIGWKPRADVERVTVEIGYWLGVAHAGRGITTEALQCITPWLIREQQLTRVEARLFLRNRASARVLEKAGYVREALMRRSAIKADEVLDQELWAFVVDQPGVLPQDAGIGQPW
jgi:[ribosomal protein S5]-alanine N-acetyltransferase